MVNWFIIIILVIAVFLMFKVSHIKHSRRKFFIIIMILLVFFFLASFYFVSTRNKTDLTTTKGLGTGIKLYAGWLASSFQNIKSLAGYASKMNWTNINGSFFNKTDKSNGSGKFDAEGFVNNTLRKIKPNVPKPIPAP